MNTSADFGPLRAFHCAAAPGCVPSGSGSPSSRRLDPSAQGTLTRTLSAEGFRIDGTGQSVVLTWKGVHSAVETPEFLLIFLNKVSAYYVPKRLISTPHELQAVRDLLQANLGERAQLAPHHCSR